ncbi:MAG: tyrosine-type recombinase/integrase [Acidobacteriota bacterium]|nr:tyrosine-type recombinase/integrase [Acidobacteriota bacterium]
MAKTHKPPGYPEYNSWWEVGVERYERRANLNRKDRAALAPFRNRGKVTTRLWAPHEFPALVWLAQPIVDILNAANIRSVTNVRREHINGTVHILLRESLRRGRTYWVWTSEEWIETICKSNKAFGRRHALDMQYRPYVILIAYLLGNFTDFFSIKYFLFGLLAMRAFGRAPVELATEKVTGQLATWGYRCKSQKKTYTKIVGLLLLENRSPKIEEITPELLLRVRELRYAGKTHNTNRKLLISVSRALVGLGIVPEALPANPVGWGNKETHPDPATLNLSPEWASWCKRWKQTTSLQRTSAQSVYSGVLCAGRWLNKVHPEVTSPAQWTVPLCAEYVAAIVKAKVGQWTSGAYHRKHLIGKPLAPATKVAMLGALRTFLRDCQEWEWIPRRFNAARALATPRSVSSLIGPAPRPIASDIWAKLLFAALNLSEEDLTRYRGYYIYPLEMIRAVAIVWLFSGLRNDEIIRLRVGCVRWLDEPTTLPPSGDPLDNKSVCFLTVPTNKTCPEFTKPVDRVLGEAIEAWERVRFGTPLMLDKKSGELVEYLFARRSKRLGRAFINQTLIPLLCRRANVPEADARGDITSHRARSTMASHLANSREPMSLQELNRWLGHTRLSSTLHYIETTPVKLAKAYQDADYFGRNMRTIQVLIDQETILSGAAARGEPWRFYDLGHGHCANEYFVECPHRMACAKCSFYVPKDSAKALLLEGKANLLRLRQEIPLTDDEVAAVDEGVEALEKLCRKLADIPTPEGLTPHQLSDGNMDMKLVKISRL